MARNTKRIPFTPEQIAEWSTPSHARRAGENSQYWLKRSDAILKHPNPSKNQLERQPWFEQHGIIWGIVAEKLEKLAKLELEEEFITAVLEARQEGKPL